MLKRLPLILLLTAEGVLAALLVAMIAGALPLGWARLVWLIGVAGALSAAVAVVFPDAGRRLARQGALAIGALLFLLPFVWLVGTSFKQPEETLIFPPRWLPGLAAAPVMSPWEDELGVHDVRLSSIGVRDRTGQESPAEAAWRTDSDSATLAEDRLHYDLSADQTARATATFAMPTAEPAAVVVRMRQDASWHGLSAMLDTGGRRYRSTDALYLGADGWRELTFRLPEADAPDERALGIWPLREAGAGDVPAGEARLTLTIHRKGRPGATLARWTQSYRDAWYADENWPNYMLNSAWIVLLAVIGQVLSCSMAAYAFARLRWPGRDLVFGVVLATMMLPTMVVMVPQFLIFKSLGWYNTLLPLWVPAFLGTPFFIFLLRQFMLGVPRELEEAARIDGCSWWGIYWRIMLPLMKPALAAVAIFTFMNAWNEFMQPLIYLNDSRLYPLPLGLFAFRGEHQFQFNMLMAASTLMTLPVVALFFLAQRYFIEGITLTGLKG